MITKKSDTKTVSTSLCHILTNYDKKIKKKDLSDIEICFNLMYGILLLRVQKKEISESTLQAAQVVSRFLAILSKNSKKRRGRVKYL